ncbi:MAG: hypothetical protein PF517_16810 [Salinivirgaceae bacterium]|jgi:hypothetical protein|nr:hypothetical protein [Salinivirgaceae bacterium]
MKNLFNQTSIAIVLFAIILFSACSGGSKKTGEDNSVITEIKKDKVKEDVTEFVYPLPTAFEVTKMLNRIGASYILSLSNPAENAEKYFTEKSKALNLGIYSADLSYASTYNQKQNIIDYMNASNKLVEELGFENAIDKELPAKIELVENDKDKLIDLISNTFYTTYESLNENGRGSVSVLVLAGSWVEALYIATHISKETYNNVEMVKIVMEQRAPLNKLMSLVEDFESQPDIAEVGKSLKKLQEIFNSLEVGSISQEQMIAISTEVEAVRASIVD